MLNVQTIRLIDVFAIAPILIYSGTKESMLPKWVKMSLVVIGIATILYNGTNYLKNLDGNK